MLKLGAIARRGLGLGLGAFFIEGAVLGFGKGTRLGDVGGPLGALGLRELREKLVAEADQLSTSTAWKVTTERFAAIVEEWKLIPRSDRAKENELWKQISAARTTFDKARRAHYVELDAQRSSAKAAKEALVKQAQALSTSRDWQKTTGEYRKLLDQWKKAGRAWRCIR